MPLKIIEARNAKAKSLYIRGTYLGVAVDKSCGTNKYAVARAILRDTERRIEQQIIAGPEAAPDREQPTFIGAAVSYLEAGRRRPQFATYIAKLIEHFGETTLPLTQKAIDDAAIALYPNVTPATRNAHVYTPVSVIHHHAGFDNVIKRPKGAKGRVVTDWLVTDDAFGIIEAADKFDPEYATLLTFLLYTGVRLGAALNLNREDVRPSESAAWVRHQKGQPASDVRLRDDLRDRLSAHMRTHNNRRVFRFNQGGHLKHQLVRAKLGYLGIACPVRRPKGWQQPPNRLQAINHHSFRHTWATWMRQAGADVQGLVATGNWRDPKSAARYAHAVARDEWSRVDMLPGRKRA